MLTIGDKFPAFSLAGINEKNEFVRVDYDNIWSYGHRKWTVIYFYPKDFTFICPTEIAGMDILVDEANVIGISGDNEFCKLAWKEHNDIIRSVQHPLCCDAGSELAKELGAYNAREGVPYRATFILNPDHEIQHYSVNALDTGRNANETLRTLQALQAGGLTGCAWQPGDEFVA